MEKELQAGRLVEVIPAWKPRATPIYTVTPDKNRTNPLIRRFIDHLGDRFESALTRN